MRYSNHPCNLLPLRLRDTILNKGQLKEIHNESGPSTEGYHCEQGRLCVCTLGTFRANCRSIIGRAKEVVLQPFWQMSGPEDNAEGALINGAG